MAAPRRPRSALYRMEAYGLGNPWNLWALANGELTDMCRGCPGTGRVVTRPCDCTEPGTRWCPEPCTRDAGCPHCLKRCPDCYGRGLRAEPVHVEDFGDAEALEIAQQLFDVRDGVEFYRKRIDMHAPAL